MTAFGESLGGWQAVSSWVYFFDGQMVPDNPKTGRISSLAAVPGVTFSVRA
jgi:hypothetical protein